MKKNKILKVTGITLGIIALLFVVGSFALGGYIADKILHQNAGKDTHDNSLKQMEKWGYDAAAFEDAYKGTDIKVQAEDGNEVPATYYNSNSGKCVILVHGAGGDRACVYPLAEQFLMRGYDVIAIDQRGSGVNPDDRVTFGINESLDVKAVVAYARNELSEIQVIVHGQSMGGQTVAVYASNVTPGSAEAADAVIFDSPVPGMELVLKEVFGDGDVDSFTARYFTFTSKVFMKLIKGIDYDDADTIEIVKNDIIPTLVIVSDQDSVCLPDQVEKIYENVAAANKDILHFDSAHIEGVIDYPEEYMSGVTEFLGSAGL